MTEEEFKSMQNIVAKAANIKSKIAHYIEIGEFIDLGDGDSFRAELYKRDTVGKVDLFRIDGRFNKDSNITKAFKAFLAAEIEALEKQYDELELEKGI